MTWYRVFAAIMAIILSVPGLLLVALACKEYDFHVRKDKIVLIRDRSIYFSLRSSKTFNIGFPALLLGVIFFLSIIS